MILVSSDVSKAVVLAIVRGCMECQSIDPAPMHWKAGRLDVQENWNRVGIDMTHFGGHYYLMLIDCGQS